MYMLINVASKATKRPWQKAPLLQWMHSMWSVWRDGSLLGGSSVHQAFTDNELQAVLQFWYLCCIAIEWRKKTVNCHLFICILCICSMCFNKSSGRQKGCGLTSCVDVIEEDKWNLDPLTLRFVVHHWSGHRETEVADRTLYRPKTVFKIDIISIYCSNYLFFIFSDLLILFCFCAMRFDRIDSCLYRVNHIPLNVVTVNVCDKLKD